MIETYKHLEAWKNGIDLAVMVYKLTSELPESHSFSLATDMLQTSIAVPSNIAMSVQIEDHNIDIEYLEIAFMKLRELETQLIVANDISYLKAEQTDKCFALINLIRSQISGYFNDHKVNERTV